MKRQLRKIALSAFTSATLLGLAGCQTIAISMLNRAEVTSIAVEGEKLYIMDLLNSKTFGQMQDTINLNPQVTTLVFTAMPGSIDDEVTFEMGRWLKAKGLNTHLTSESVIASGAVDLFLSGTERTMEAGAKIGVHSWSDGSKEAADYPRDSKEHALNRDYIVDMGVPEDFYWFTIYEAPADEIHWMSQGEIVKHRLLTTPIRTDDSSATIPFEHFTKMRLEVLKAD